MVLSLVFKGLEARQGGQERQNGFVVFKLDKLPMI